MTWLTKNTSQSPTTATRFCYQRTLPLGNTHCLGTTCQFRGRCVFAEGSYPGTKEMIFWEAKHASNCPRKPASGPAARPGKESCRWGWAHWTSVGSDFSPLLSSLYPPPTPSPKRSFNTLFPLKSWGFGDSPGSHMVPMSPWPLQGRGAGKTNESSCNSAALEFRPARQKGLQACSQIRSGTWHAKAIFNHWIYFFPTPFTILHLSKCFEVRAKPKSIPGVQGNPERLFRSRTWARKQNCSTGPAAKLSCSFLRTVQISHPKHWANSLKEEISEWMCPARMTLNYVFSLAALAREGAWDRSQTHWDGTFFPSLEFSIRLAVRMKLNMLENAKA